MVRFDIETKIFLLQFELSVTKKTNKYKKELMYINGGDKIISASTQKININSYTGGDLKVSNKTLTPNLNKINSEYDLGQITANDDFKDIDLPYEEYSFEELLKAGEKRYDEIQEQLAKDQAEADKFEDKVKKCIWNIRSKRVG